MLYLISCPTLHKKFGGIWASGDAYRGLAPMRHWLSLTVFKDL